MLSTLLDLIISSDYRRDPIIVNRYTTVPPTCQVKKIKRYALAHKTVFFFEREDHSEQRPLHIYYNGKIYNLTNFQMARTGKTKTEIENEVWVHLVDITNSSNVIRNCILFLNDDILVPKESQL